MERVQRIFKCKKVIAQSRIKLAAVEEKETEYMQERKRGGVGG